MIDVENVYLILISGVMSNTKYKLLILGFFFLFACNDNIYAPQPIIAASFSPKIKFESFTEEEILNAKIYLKKENSETEIGMFKNIDSLENVFFPMIELSTLDTIYKTDTLKIEINDNLLNLYDIQKVSVVSKGNPFVIEYKSDGVLYHENDCLIFSKLK